MTAISTGAKQMPALDESSFQQLLAAAYVVQAHNDELHAKAPQANSSPVLSEIARINTLWRAGTLDLAGSVKLVAERLREVTNAAGVSIGLITNGYLDCVSEAGAPASVPGSSLASHSLVATERLKAHKVFESAGAQTDIRLDGLLCARFGVGSLVAAPVLRSGELAGLVEARWAQASGFQESEVAACRLFAELITGVLQAPIASAEQTLPDLPLSDLPIQDQSVLTASHLDSVQKIAAANEDSPVVSSTDREVPEVEVHTSTAPTVQEMKPALGESCRVCGRPFGADEAFCGHCSMPRASAAPARRLQSKWASLWHMQQAQNTLQEAATARAESPVEGSGAFTRVVARAESLYPESEADAAASARVDHFSYFEPLAVERRAEMSLRPPDEPSLWVRISRRFRNAIRVKDLLMLLVAGVLAFGVVSAWPSSTGRPTWFQSALGRVGLSRRPAISPVYGNPEVSVWMDVHNALYYCPGSDLYGKTPDGRFGSQREAQQQRIEPAAGLACQ